MECAESTDATDLSRPFFFPALRSNRNLEYVPSLLLSAFDYSKCRIFITWAPEPFSQFGNSYVKMFPVSPIFPECNSYVVNISTNTRYEYQRAGLGRLELNSLSLFGLIV